MNLQIGATVGDYQVVGIIGAGGMGKVYKVRNVISDRVEAMKVLLPDLVTEAELADRFLREIKVQASLEHPNIASLHTAMRAENQILMLMELVEGVTLEQRSKDDGPIPTPLAIDYFMQALSALEYAHDRGIIHRDIKPANMMVTPQGVVKLMDFGIAKAATEQRLTRTGTTMGSLYYMSPEQIQGASNIDARADLYSVGVSLYELVTGEKPFDGDSQFAIMSAHLEKDPIPPVTIDPNLPQALNDVILMSVAKEPRARFQTAGLFRDALGDVLPGGQPVGQTITQPMDSSVEFPVARRPSIPTIRGANAGVWMAAGALALAAAVIGITELGPWKETTAAPQTQAPAAPAPRHEVSRRPTLRTQPWPQPQTGSPASRLQILQQRLAQPPRQDLTSPPVPPSALRAGPNSEELENVREHMMQLTVRANGIRSSLQSLQSAQAASGLNLSSTFTGSAGLMDGYLKQASDALTDSNLDLAERFLEKAERQVEILEKLLNR